MPDPALTALLFGKLPTHGDFVARGLSPDRRDPLDRWLTASLADAQAAHGARFADRYEEAPPWRFAWTGPKGWTAGAMALSVDAIGRRYPILLALGGLGPERVDAATAALEELIYDAFAASWDADQLHARAASITPALGAPWRGGEGWWTLGAERFNEQRVPGARPAGLMTAILTPGEAGGDAAGEPDEG